MKAKLANRLNKDVVKHKFDGKAEQKEKKDDQNQGNTWRICHKCHKEWHGQAWFKGCNYRICDFCTFKWAKASLESQIRKAKPKFT